MKFIELIRRAAGGNRESSRASGLPRLRRLTASDIRAEDVETLTVMVSSPRSGLEELRDLLNDVIDRFPNVKAQLFEFLGRQGTGPVDTSETLIEDADVVVVLLGRDVGSQVPGTRTTFSQREVERLRELQKTRPDPTAPSGRPRVLVYAHKLEGRQLEPWEAELQERYGHFASDDAEALAAQITVDLAAALLAERQQQAAALLPVRAERDDARSRVKALEEQINTYRQEVSAIQKQASIANDLIRQQAEEFERAHESREQRVLDANRKAEKAESSRNTWARRALAAGVIGLVAGAVLSLGPIGIYFEHLNRQWSRSTEAQRIGLEQIATAVHDLGIHMPMPHDPRVIRAKIQLAQSLNQGFDCSVLDQQAWSVIVDGKQLDGASFERAAVCESFGAFVLRLNANTKNCEVQRLPPEVAVALARTFKQLGEMEIRLLRVVGHASVDRIETDCGPIDETLLMTVSAAPSLLAADDRRIKTNSQLAWVRAAAFAVPLADAFREAGLTPAPTVLRAAMGVVERLSSSDAPPHSLDRRVDVEIFVSDRRPPTPELAPNQIVRRATLEERGD